MNDGLMTTLFNRGHRHKTITKAEILNAIKAMALKAGTDSKTAEHPSTCYQTTSAQFGTLK